MFEIRIYKSEETAMLDDPERYTSFKSESHGALLANWRMLFDKFEGRLCCVMKDNEVLVAGRMSENDYVSLCML